MDRLLFPGNSVSADLSVCLGGLLTFNRVASALRRIYLVRWQYYMDESLQILENHPNALPSDRKVIWWAKLARIMEQAGTQLTPEDPQIIIAFSDSKVRYTIKAFANQLAQYRREIPEEFWTGNVGSLTNLGPYVFLTYNISTFGPHVLCHESFRA